ncbi:MAG: hypothetical protein AAF721_05915 [Myxococcota bacterium]
MKPHLWSLEDANGDPARLARLLADATAEQLILLRRRYGIAAAELRDRAAFRDHAADGYADALARWVVTRGERAYGLAMEDPSTLPDRPPSDAPDLYGTIGAVYAQRFGHPIPDQEPEPADLSALGPDPAWVEPVWNLIDLVQLGIPIAQAASGYTRSELIRLYYTASQIALHSVDARLRVAFPDECESEWHYLASHAMSQGRERLDSLLAAPEQLRDLMDGYSTITSWLNDLYWERYGDQIGRRPRPPGPTPSQGVPALLWPLVGMDPADLRARLAGADAEQLILLHRHYRDAKARLIAHASFAPDRPVDARESLAAWVIAQGREAFDAALRGEGSLPASPPRFDDRGELIRAAFEARFVAPLPDQEPDPSLRYDRGALRATPAWTEALWDLQDSWSNGLPFEEAAAGYPRTALLCLATAAEALVEGPITDEIRAALGDDPEGLEWFSVAQWMLSQGRASYEAMKQDPSRIPRDPPDAPRIQWAIEELHEQRYGRPMFLGSWR